MEKRVQGKVLVVSGPSGCGKSTICRDLLKDDEVHFSISATTRTPRKGEVDGRDYHFIDEARFRDMVEEGAFVEWAEVHGNLYGTLKEPLEKALEAGQVYLLEIDVQGGMALKKLQMPWLFVFVAPPDLDTLHRRLVARGTDSPEVIERRMKKAGWEMDMAGVYDHVVVNEDLERAIQEVRQLAGLSQDQNV